MSIMQELRRYAVFSSDGDGGNPGAVLLSASGLSDRDMQAIATEVGYSETGFVLAPITTTTAVPVRYFAPEGEIPFCGHVTVATAVAFGETVGAGRFVLQTEVGEVAIEAGPPAPSGGPRSGSFDSAPIGYQQLPEHELADLLAALHWHADHLHPDWAPGIGMAGNAHPVLVAADLRRLADLDYDFPRLQTLCRAHGWITIQLVTPNGDGRWRARIPFPWGGVVEDPATGSAAAAFTGYLQAHGAVRAGSRLTIEQGVEMGRPSRLEVTVLHDRAKIGGRATPIT